MRRIILSLILSATAVWAAVAQSPLGDLRASVRAGLSIGGTAPLGMPSTIRSLDSYALELNPLAEVDLQKMFNSNWGMLAGLRFDRKAMDITATVKNYHITIVRGGEALAGMFTGRNHTSEHQYALSLPVNATYNIANVRIFAGPYFSYVAGRHFEGYAYDGYLRVDDPTGPKVELGTAPDERGTYDFSDRMRRFQWGAQAGADWWLGSHWGIFAMVQWGLNGIHESDFHTIEQTLYPIYGTVGVAFRL